MMSLMWALGLSHISMGCVLMAMGCPASRMSSWRAVQEVGSAAGCGISKRATGRTPVMGADETIVKVRAKPSLLGSWLTLRSASFWG